MQSNEAIWIQRAINSLPLNVSQISLLSTEESLHKRAEIKRAFLSVPGEPTWWWEHLKGPTVRWLCEKGYAYIEALCPPEPCFFLPLEDAENELLYLTTPAAAMLVLSECPCFEYSIVDHNLRWILIESHHDELIAVGEPVLTRLNALKTESV